MVLPQRRPRGIEGGELCTPSCSPVRRSARHERAKGQTPPSLEEATRSFPPRAKSRASGSIWRDSRPKRFSEYGYAGSRLACRQARSKGCKSRRRHVPPCCLDACAMPACAAESKGPRVQMAGAAIRGVRHILGSTGKFWYNERGALHQDLGRSWCRATTGHGHQARGHRT